MKHTFSRCFHEGADTSLFLTVQLLILLQQVAMAHLGKEVPTEDRVLEI